MRYVEPEINKPQGAPLIILRDPQDEDVARGRPAVGRVGSLLFGGYDPLLKTHIGGAIDHAGMTRGDVNIAYRVQSHAWNDEFYRHSWDAINSGERNLREVISTTSPSIIMACGPQAIYDLVPQWRTLTDRPPDKTNTGGATIKSAKAMLDRRGFLWYPEETGLPCPVLATMLPEEAFFQPIPNRILLDIDFKRMGAVLRGTLPRQSFPEFHRIWTPADMESIWNADLVSYDIELRAGGNAFLCIAFYTSDGQAFLAYDDAFWAVKEWLMSDRPKLAHNSQFDRYFLQYKMGVKVGGRHEDSICGHWACYPELAGKEDTGRETQKKKSKVQVTRKGLNFLASFHLNLPWWKTYTSDRNKMGRLCVNDVYATLLCNDIIQREIDELGVRWQYERQLKKLPSLIAVQGRGFRIDEEMRQKRLSFLDARQIRLQEEATEAALAYLQEHNITHDADGKEYKWYHAAQCKCCGGGSHKRAHCPTCAGVKTTGANGSIRKPDLILWAWRNTRIEKADLDKMKKDALMDLIPPCGPCGGEGKVDTWDFNPMSSTQLPALLWDHLNVPLHTCNGTPNADEETITKVLEWAREG